MKTAIVTGASGNLGQAVVKKFIEEGYRVIGTTEPNDPVAVKISSPNYEEIVVDLRDEDNTAKFIHSIITRYKQIDTVILTVGGFVMGNIESTTSADIMEQYKLNFETAYHVARPSFVQMMKQESGRIFLIGSRPGLSSAYSKGMIAYGLVKSLIFRLAELLNDEAKGKNVVTNVIVPSTIDTPENRHSMPDADFSKWVKPEDIASVIFYYCADQALILRENVIKVYNNA